MIDVINLSNPLTLDDALEFIEEESKHPNRPRMFIYHLGGPFYPKDRAFVVARHILTRDDHRLFEETRLVSHGSEQCSRIDLFNILTV